MLIALPPDPLDATGFERDLCQIAARFAGQCFLGAAPRYDGQDQERLDRLAEISQITGLAMVAVGDVLMHRSNRRPLADVLTCIREGYTIDTIGDRRLANGEHRLKSGEELARIFHRYPGALRRTVEITDRCAFGMDQFRYQYPDEARDGEQVTHLIAECIEDLSTRLSTIGHQLRIGAETERAGETVRPTRTAERARHPREQAKKLIPSRDFH